MREEKEAEEYGQDPNDTGTPDSCLKCNGYFNHVSANLMSEKDNDWVL